MPKHFSVDARAMLTWGRDSIKDHTIAVLELVKNSYDAASSVVVVTIHSNDSDPDNRYLRISDAGDGMSEAGVTHNWLRLGFSEKLEQKKTRHGRRKTGEKGIGRVSADRLGEILELRTQARDCPPVGLVVRWADFESAGKDLTTIPIGDVKAPAFMVPYPQRWDETTEEFEPLRESRRNSARNTGTELTIRRLRDVWTRQGISDLRHALAALTPPFRGVEDFQIRIENDIDPEANGIVECPFPRTAEIEASFSVQPNSEIACKFSGRTKTGKTGAAIKRDIPWQQFVHQTVAETEESRRVTSEPSFGPVDVELLFYPRKVETLRGTDLALGDLKEFLDTNAGISSPW